MEDIRKGQFLCKGQVHGDGGRGNGEVAGEVIAAIQLGRVGIVPGGESAVRAAARVGGDTAGIDGDRRFGRNALRLGDVEGHRLLYQLGQLDGLVHIGGRNTDRAGGSLIAELADGVGVVTRLYLVHAIAAGDGFAFLIFQSDRRVRLVRRYGQRVQRGNGEVFELESA